MALVQTYDGLVRVVDGLVELGCCCVTCIPGNEPTAAFSYEQIGYPCTIDLTDESTVHANCTDGTIVSWKWYKNGVLFSTAQNPTDIEVEDGDLIKLWVKDSCGCTDEVEQAVECVDCCLVEGGPPTAGFSYEQTGSDPCCFAFTDESAAGSCGAIVSRLWDFGDGSTSTATNPTHCYSGTGPWDVTLTVIDAADCEDDVIGEVECIDEEFCSCEFDVPDTMTLITSGLSGGGAGQCLKFNGTWVVTRIPGTSNYELTTTVSGTIMHVLVSYVGSGKIRASIENDSSTKLLGACFDGICGASWDFDCPVDCMSFGPISGTLVGTDLADCVGTASFAATLES